MPAPNLSRPVIGPDGPQRPLEKLRGELVQALRSIVAGTILDGVLLTGIHARWDAHGNPVDVAVPHNLQRAPNGWVVVAKGQSFDLWDSRADNPAPRSQLLLSHNANQTAFSTFSLWVF